MSACTDDGGGTDDTMMPGDGDGDGDTTGDGDGDDPDTTPGDGDPETTTGGCFNQPPICAQFVRCIAALVPGQAEMVESQYGEMGSCWCGATDDEAQDCYGTCVEQVANALLTAPTESQCHENVCPIEELDPDQPYGPIVDGSCSDYLTEQDVPFPQVAFMNPLGVAGGFCAPQCSGLANACPEHTQTSATGTCYISQGEDSYCISRCYVDSEIIGGTQCQCGATCQPSGGADGEGNLRGICTFE